MKVEREDIQQNYGTLVMRAFDIAGNSINAFYDSGDNLIFVLDNTTDASKPNVLLVISPETDKKWDEILSNDYGVDLETIRPKQDNKYQKLDIEYSGLDVYDNLIRAYMANDDIKEYLEQLDVLRNSAVRHSAIMRLDSANDIISKTNNTIIQTKETILKLQVRIKTLRAKLSETKKEIGKVPTKQSAAKILKLESQIEAGNEKLKRAQKRLESAQRRLDVATVDAELASDLLNQKPVKTKQNKPVMVAPKYEIKTTEPEDFDNYAQDDDDLDVPDLSEENDETTNGTEIKPLFSEDPQILNEDIAFKPISFDAPTSFNNENEIPNIPVFNKDLSDETVNNETPENIEIPEKPIIEAFEPIFTEESNKPLFEEKEDIIKNENEYSDEFADENKPVLETMTPFVEEQQDLSENNVEIQSNSEPVLPENTENLVRPVPPFSPVAPVVNKMPVMPVDSGNSSSKPTFVYYLFLFLLIVLSVFTLWLYQKNVKTTSPVLTPKIEENVVVEPVESQPTSIQEIQDDTENVFIEEIEETEEVDAENPEPVDENVEQPVEEYMNIEEVPENPVAMENVEQMLDENEEYDEEDVAPKIIGDVPGRFTTSPGLEEKDTNSQMTEEEIIMHKPAYEPGNKYDDMFISEQDYGNVNYVPVPESESAQIPSSTNEEFYDQVFYEPEYSDEYQFYDEEEERYMMGDDGYYR